MPHCKKLYQDVQFARPAHIYCNGPLSSNGQLVTDIVSAVTNADIVTATTDMHCDWVEAFQR
jgi:hypothetical protein